MPGLIGQYRVEDAEYATRLAMELGRSVGGDDPPGITVAQLEANDAARDERAASMAKHYSHGRWPKCRAGVRSAKKG